MLSSVLGWASFVLNVFGVLLLARKDWRAFLFLIGGSLCLLCFSVLIDQPSQIACAIGFSLANGWALWKWTRNPSAA